MAPEIFDHSIDFALRSHRKGTGSLVPAGRGRPSPRYRETILSGCDCTEHGLIMPSESGWHDLAENARQAK